MESEQIELSDDGLIEITFTGVRPSGDNSTSFDFQISVRESLDSVEALGMSCQVFLEYSQVELAGLSFGNIRHEAYASLRRQLGKLVQHVGQEAQAYDNK